MKLWKLIKKNLNRLISVAVDYVIRNLVEVLHDFILIRSEECSCLFKHAETSQCKCIAQEKSRFDAATKTFRDVHAGELGYCNLERAAACKSQLD